MIRAYRRFRAQGFGRFRAAWESVNSKFLIWEGK